jgi:NAD+ kinase
MVNYWVVDRGDELSVQLSARFHAMAERFGMNPDEQNPDIVLSIGGDGTMLHAFHLYKGRLDRTSFVGIHTGRLGFFADWKPDEIERLAQMIRNYPEDANLKIVQYPLVEIGIRTREGTETDLALNEFTLKGVEKMLVAELHINDEKFETFRGDGICISSPSGSTAYNKSLGGSLIHPSLEAIQIAEIASINNRVYRTLGSSIILPKHHHCDIRPQAGQNLLLTLDHLHVQRTDVLSLRLKVAGQKVRFARFRPFPFWTRVREAFIGHGAN